jgi:hypothetical protein
MVQFILEISKTIELMVKAISNTIISIMSAILKTEVCKAMDYGKIKREKNILDNGKVTKQTDMAYILLKIVIIKVHFS